MVKLKIMVKEFEICDNVLGELMTAGIISEEYVRETFSNIISSKSKYHIRRHNKGIGAGGAKTNANGLPFEKEAMLNDFRTIEPTCINPSKKGTIQSNMKKVLMLPNHPKYSCIVYVNKGGFNKFMNQYQPTSSKKFYREPDGAYICFPKSNGDKIVIKIVEIKNQNVSGSVMEKLFMTSELRYYYEKMFNGYEFQFMYCLSDYHKCDTEKERFADILDSFSRNNIQHLYVKTESYQEDLGTWVYA